MSNQEAQPITLRAVDTETALRRRVELRELVADIPQTLELPPEQWFPSFARKLINLRNNIGALNPRTQLYLSPIVDNALDEMRNESRSFIDDPDNPRHRILTQRPEREDDIAEWESECRLARGVCADAVIMKISKDMAEPFGQEPIPVEETVIPIEEIAERIPNLDIVTERIGEVDLKVVYYKNPNNGKEVRQPLPWDNTIAIKGGFARIMNDLYSGAPDSMIFSEIPPNDVDVVATGEQHEARSKAYLLGADPEGVELKSGDSLDYQDYANSRDMTINMAWVANDGLHTCPQAVEAAKTGIVEISGNYRPDKAIYNTDRFTWNDPSTGEHIVVAKQRGLSREVKATAEGKIIGFKYAGINENTPLSIYALWLAKRWQKYIENPDLPTEKFGDNLQNMFYLAEQMGHVPSGVTNVMEYLESVHIEFPFFDIRKEMRDIVDEVRWKGKKIMKQIDREYSWATSVPSEFNFIRKPGDTEERVVTLGNFVPDPEHSRKIAEWYPSFQEKCEERTRQFDKLGLRPHERYFFAIGYDDPIHEDI